MKKRVALVLVGLAVVTVTVAAYYRANHASGGPQLVTAAVSRGNVVETVEATGTLEAVTTVQVRHHQGAARRFQLAGEEGAGDCRARSVAVSDAGGSGTRDARAPSGRGRARAGAGGRYACEAEPRARAVRAPVDPCNRLRDCRGERERGHGGAESGRGTGDSGARLPQSKRREPRAHDYQGTDRWHRDLAQCGRRTDGRGEHAGAHAVHHCKRPHRDARQRQGRRVRHRPYPPRAAGDVPRRCLSERGLHGHSFPGPAPAGRRTERRQLCHGD